MSEPATGQVEYGKTTAYGSLSAAETSFQYTQHVQTLSSLTPGTLYHYRVKSADADGNLRMSGDSTFTTLAAPAPTPTPTPIPTPAPTPAPGPHADAHAGADPGAAPASGTSVRVTSISALLTALADNAVTDIVVANGTYGVRRHRRRLQIELAVDRARFAGRTNPVTVRAETRGGVTFDGGGANTFGGITFHSGAHDQTWDGFVFANAEPTQTGVIVLGQSGSTSLAPPHHITLLDLTVEATITSDNPIGMSGDHAVYFSKALTPGIHDILIDRLTVNAATSGLDSAIHFYHSAAGAPNANNVTIRHMTDTGTDQSVILWDQTLHDIVIEDSTITGALRYAVRYEIPAPASSCGGSPRLGRARLASTRRWGPTRPA